MSTISGARDPFAMCAEGESAPVHYCRRIKVGTNQQEAFWQELTDGSGNVLLQALAGTGKSTSCREGMHRVIASKPSMRMRYCCFNKAIAEDFRGGCPPGVDVGTMHSFGFKVLVNGGRTKLATDKTFRILSQLGHERLSWLERRAICKLVSLAKNHAVIDPVGLGVPRVFDELADRFEIVFGGSRRASIEIAIDVLEASAGLADIIDFDDMLWLPLILKPRFPSCDMLFIDEAQDLNPTQHALIPLLNPNGRTVVVGDSNQSIYAFRGADCESMARLQQVLDAKVMPLTVTFRCPKSHVRLAQDLVPEFEAHARNGEGVINYGGQDLLDSAQPGDLVLCRKNAPLVSACLEMIAAGRKAVMRGRAIGQSLEALVGHVSRSGGCCTITELLESLQSWRNQEVLRLSRKEGSEDLIEQVCDRASCLEAIAGRCQHPSELALEIQELFSDDDPSGYVTFSSIHRAKGSEARRVFLIRAPYDSRPVRNHWEQAQRQNLEYVGITRSLHEMNFVNLDK